MVITSRRRTVIGACSLAVLAGLLGGCSDGEGLAAQYGSGADALGQHDVMTVIPEADRGDPVDFAAHAVGGGTVHASMYRGRVLVVNLWYAGCVPCRTEAPVLSALATDNPDRVAVLGVDTVDTAAVAQRFISDYDVPYPSVLDAHGGPVRIALQRSIVANATPTTVALDADGRVAGRVLGAATKQQLDKIVSAAS
jgi:thiol-disulfide isomerase/thioredoxin